MRTIYKNPFAYNNSNFVQMQQTRACNVYRSFAPLTITSAFMIKLFMFMTSITDHRQSPPIQIKRLCHYWSNEVRLLCQFPKEKQFLLISFLFVCLVCSPLMLTVLTFRLFCLIVFLFRSSKSSPNTPNTTPYIIIILFYN